MEVKITSYEGITLKTKNKYVTDDINVLVDESLIPSGTIDITHTNEVDVTQYAKAQVKDENLKPENIAENVEVLGIMGTFKGGNDTTDATAVETDILLGKTAYSNGGKITGTIETYDGTADVGAVNVMKQYLDFKKSTSSFFSSYEGTNVDEFISYNDTENVTNMSYMFQNCKNLTHIPSLNTSNVTAMSSMFSGCNKLPEIPLLDTSKVTTMYFMFDNCHLLQTIPLLDTSKVTNMGSMFQSCKLLETLPLLNTSNVTSMRNMLRGCEKLTEIPLLDTSKVTDMSYMFYNCYGLEMIHELNTSIVTDISNMFYGCSALKTLPQLDTSEALNINYIFYSCTLVAKIDITNLDKVTSAQRICNNCSSLTKFIIRTMTKIPTLTSDPFAKCYHFTGTVNETYNPDGLKDGRIYVPDEFVEQLKVATNWSTYADIIVPLSTLEEE